MTISSKPNMAMLWATQGSFEAPTDAKITTGWVAEIPPYEFQNWWQHRADQAINHIYEAGIAVWDASTLYTAGRSIVQSSDGTLWRAAIDNTGQNPATTTGIWAKLIEETRYVPVGAIMEFPMVASVPDGYLHADGSQKSRTAYPELFALLGTTYGAGDGITTFNLPDYRGIFRRGWDSGRGIDTGRSVNVIQSSQNLQHTHSGTTNSGGTHNHSGTTDGAGSHSHSGSTSASGDHTHPNPVGSGYILSGSQGVGNNGTMQGGYPGGAGFGTSWSNFTSTGAAGNHTHSISTNAAGAHSHNLSISSGGDHTHIFSTNSSGGNESRPINLPVLVCIKF